jgi:hypothetical protein
MSEVSMQSIIEQVEQLPLNEQLAVTAQLQERALELTRQINKGRFLGRAPYQDDNAADQQWLRDHHQEYVGQWVALKDGQLLAHGPRLREVLANSAAQGVKVPLVSFIEPSHGATLF